MTHARDEVWPELGGNHLTLPEIDELTHLHDEHRAPAALVTGLGIPVPGPWWFACHRPEQPADCWTIWLAACDRCYLKLQVDATLADDDHLIGRYALALDEARTYRTGKGLRT